MKKTELVNFINRYYLAGATTSVKWKSNAGTLETDFISDDQNVIGTIKSNIDLGNNELGVYATPQLTKMLSAVSDDIDVKVNDVDGTAVSIDIKDNDIEMKFMLADLSVIRQVPALKQLPDWSTSFELSKEFIDKFIKAKNAIPDSENFGVSCNNAVANVIINYSTINTNRIKFSVKCDKEKCEDMSMVCFSSNGFKEILQANKDAESAKLEVSGAGLAKATFTSKSFASIYYLVQLQVA